MTASEEIRSTFETHRYVALHGILPAPIVEFLYDHIRQRAEAGTLGLEDKQVPGTPVAYGDPVTDRLLEELRPALEEVTGRRLLPTYSFYRLYKKGDVLERHRDRPACEISMSVNLGQVPETPWPLWIEGPLGATGVAMGPGDAVLYHGMECDHWREPFAGEHLAQVFLHWVDRDGPHRGWKFDKREALGQPQATAR